MSFEHFIAELQCFLRGGHTRPKPDEFHPIEVYYVYSNGKTEKVADDICEVCGHFIGKPGKPGLNKVRGEEFDAKHSDDN